MRLFRTLIGCLLIQTAFSFSAKAEPVDALLVTGLDFSSSMDYREILLEMNGLERALESPEFVKAATSGKYKKIGFQLFFWGSTIYPCIDWTIISSVEDAQIISNKLKECEIKIEKMGERIKEATDISGAMITASNIFRDSPYSALKKRFNIVGDGEDNVGTHLQDVTITRELLISKDITINAMITDNDPDLLLYFQTKIVGGPAHFAFQIKDENELFSAFLQKFLLDIS